MYNKIFGKLLNSSIWLEPNSTRIVWLTLLISMDEDGFAQFAAIGNLAHRAIVTEEECKAAIKTLESPDPNSSDKDNDGIRIERVPGGWMILNYKKYSELANREAIKNQTRIRVANHRAMKRTCNASVTPSDTDKDTNKDSESGLKKSKETPLAEENISTWKPSSIRKAELLAKVRMPKSYPSQDQFNDFVTREGLAGLDHRGDLYLDLCINKWHHWDKDAHRWTLIRDWKNYVLKLDEKIESNRANQ